jgi:hypothetical protein
LYFVYQRDPAYTQYDGILSTIDRVAGPAVDNIDAKFGTVVARNVFDTFGHANTAVSRAFVGPYDETTNFNQELAARNIAMAQDSNAAILQFKCIIQSAVGSFAFEDTQAPYTEDRDRLWRTHIRNCHSTYCEAGRGVWQQKESSLLLASSDYLIGLSTSSGTTFPITIDCTIRFGNLAGYSGGVCFSVGAGHKGKMEFETNIIGEPVCVGLFHQNVLSIAASSAVLSSQAFSQATTAAALQSS